MPRVRLGGPGVPVERLDPHPAHQGGHVLAAHGHAVEAQQVPEHPAPGKGMQQMQFVELPHQGQGGCRDRLACLRNHSKMASPALHRSSPTPRVEFPR